MSLEDWGDYGRPKNGHAVRRGRGGMGGGGMPGGPMADGAEMAVPPPAAPAMAGEAGPTAGGARAAEKAKAEPDQSVALREFFPDTILWQPTVITDGSGQATVTVEFPDSLTTWRATARAVTKDTMVGQQVHNVVTTKDLIVRLQAPRFFTQLDQSVISLVVTNKTSHAQTVAVGLGVEGLQLEGGNETVEVPPLGQKRLDRKVTATEPGEAVITVTAKGPDDSDGVRQKFTVIPHGATKFAAKAGRIGAEATAAFDLDLPADRRDDATKLDVTVSPTLASTLLDALPYLVDYPYGCVEQTTSKFIPCVLVARTLEYTGKPAAGGKPVQVPDWWKKRGLDDLPKMVNDGIKRLSAMKNPDGGFGWFGGMRSDVWMTSYVVNGLMQARLADYTVPDDVLQPAIAFLYANLHLLGEQLDSSAYVGWVLSEALANQVFSPSAEQRKALEDVYQRVYANRDDLNDYTRALLILGLKNRGESEKAAVAWRNLQARRIETEHGVHWGRNPWGWRWSEDQVETTAFALQAALAMEPDSELTHKAAQWLVLNRTGNRWYSTKDTATALFALCRYASQQKELGSTYTVSLTVNGQAVKGWEVTPQNALTLDGSMSVDARLLHTGANRIELKRDGGSGCWYSAMLEFYSREDPIKGAGHYLKADRTYYKVTDYTDPEDKTRKTKREVLKDGETVASGDQLEVDVTVDAENSFDYVCLADPKPAGCEPVDQLSGGDWNGAWMYREMHDREVTFFADHLPQGKTTLTYRLRAESPGVFRALPHRGFSMYRPDVRCLSDEAIVSIGETAEG
ncbi:MAG: hypothetical protein HYU66_13620 [Armatimonadetes bacterium]|nr:hypothetical protein [Armatimonadota bacterium]